MPEWTAFRQRYEHVRGRPFTLDGVASRGLVVSPSPDVLGWWVVSHAPSGRLASPLRYRTEQAALDAARSLLRAGDWARPAAVVVRDPALQAAWRRARHRRRGG